MRRSRKLRALLAAALNAAREQEAAAARIAARAAWAHGIPERLVEANRRLTQAWDRIFDDLPEDVSDEELEKVPDPPEQAELDAIHAQIDAVLKRDQWPRNLYWSL